MLSDALKTDISSSRSLTYRRNVLAIGSVLALLYWYPKINRLLAIPSGCSSLRLSGQVAT